MDRILVGKTDANATLKHRSKELCRKSIVSRASKNLVGTAPTTPLFSAFFKEFLVALLVAAERF